MHGGTIQADSEVGRGTTFWARVPFGTKHLPHDRLREPARGQAPLHLAHAFVHEALRWHAHDTSEAPSELLSDALAEGQLHTELRCPRVAN
jgi:hypothetical protein